MKKLFLITAALLSLLGSWPVSAADLPVMITKGPVFGFQTSGFYAGIEAGAAVANSKIGGSDLFAGALVKGNLVAAGGTIGGCAGWISGHGGGWYGIHSCVDYQNITASTDGANAGIVSRWSATQEVRIGGNPLTWFMAVLPNLGISGLTFPTFTPPSVNGGINLSAAPHSYFAAGISETGISGNFGSATGAQVAVAPMVKMGAIWQSLDGVGRPNGGAVDVYAQVTFASRGITFDRVLAANGNLVSSGSVSQGNVYKTGLAYYFTVPSAYR